MDAAARIFRMLACVALALCLTSVAEACPTCKQAFSEAGNHEGMVRGYFWSILFMMAMPFLILGGLATYFYVQVVKARVVAGTGESLNSTA